MTPSDETIEEYIRIMSEDFNENLDETTAREEVASLMRLFAIFQRAEITN
ncbi:MAG: hypothetical protein R8P61_28210 [Bacteroidia bacterium]|nr:hypothetical protein [Bacteroidia bacterium]